MQLQTNNIKKQIQSIADLNNYEIKKYIRYLEKLDLHTLEVEIKRNKIQSLCQQNQVFNEAILLTILSKC